VDEGVESIVGLRVVERVRNSFSKEGFRDLVVVSRRIQFRRRGSDKWEEMDVVIEGVDDKTRAYTDDFSQ
jgi:hypothetical protein